LVKKDKKRSRIKRLIGDGTAFINEGYGQRYIHRGFIGIVNEEGRKRIR